MTLLCCCDEDIILTYPCDNCLTEKLRGTVAYITIEGLLKGSAPWITQEQLDTSINGVQLELIASPLPFSCSYGTLSVPILPVVLGPGGVPLIEVALFTVVMSSLGPQFFSVWPIPGSSFSYEVTEHRIPEIPRYDCNIGRTWDYGDMIFPGFESMDWTNTIITLTWP